MSHVKYIKSQSAETPNQDGKLDWTPLKEMDKKLQE
jgi:hypothetical protein